MKDNVWFVNFNGIGNGIIIAPILACFEKTYPLLSYFHTENEVLSHPWFQEKAGIKGPNGYSLVEWRRFKKEDWPAIIDFIKQNNIGTIVNLRNEGPKYDVNYYQFKDFFKEREIDYFDLDFTEIENRSVQQNLTADILSLFNQLGVDTMRCDYKWLMGDKGHNFGIGFGMTASHKNKKWPLSKWIELGKELVNKDKKIVLFPGTNDEEKEEAFQIKKELGENCSIVKDLPLDKVVQEINKLELFVSNDTGLLHMAAASDIPTVGLYIVTDPNIWSPIDKSNFKYLTNPNFEKCSNRKIHCGNCVHYATTCDALVTFGDGIEPLEVLKLVIRTLDR